MVRNNYIISILFVVACLSLFGAVSEIPSGGGATSSGVFANTNVPAGAGTVGEIRVINNQLWVFTGQYGTNWSRWIAPKNESAKATNSDSFNIGFIESLYGVGTNTLLANAQITTPVITAPSMYTLDGFSSIQFDDDFLYMSWDLSALTMTVTNVALESEGTALILNQPQDSVKLGNTTSILTMTNSVYNFAITGAGDGQIVNDGGTPKLVGFKNQIVESGIATLASGVIQINTTNAHSTNVIQVTYKSIDLSVSPIAVTTIVDDTSFQILSGNAADTNKVYWTIVKP